MVWPLLWVIAQCAFSTITLAYVPPSSLFVKTHGCSLRTENVKIYQQRSPPRLSQKFVIDDRLPDDEVTNISGSSQKTDNINLAIVGAMIAIPLVAYFSMPHGEAIASTVVPLAAAVANKNIFDPSQFQPVCPASDGVYQVLKITANSLVGQENVIEYGPLIASVLLRIRLELCVLESFLYEAVLPFIQKKGLTWILPLHETVETFLAGTIFAIASNFILLGSTKILSILFIYADAITGMPTRFVGNALKKLPNNSPGERVGLVLKFYGDVLGGIRGLLESGDTFVGRYLVVATTIYIAFKFAHFKLFNDLIPF